MRRLLGLFLLTFCVGCNNGGFGGSSGKKSDSGSKDGSGDPTDDDDVDDKTAADDLADGEGEGDATDDLAEGSLDENGALVDECKVVTELPGDVTKPVELFHWIASGPTASYNQVMATPAVGKLSASSNSTIVATAFPESCDYT